MRFIGHSKKIIFVVSLFFIFGGCEKTPEPDPCLKTKWPQAKEYEIKLAIRVKDTNPLLPGGSVGSQKPEDFQSMVVNGTIEKVECNNETAGPVGLGNSYITKGIDWPAPIDVSNGYWIGHVVYVYEFDNDNDRLDIHLTVTVTMNDGQSYSGNMSAVIDDQNIVLVPGEMYYYVLLDFYSELWVKV
jgi:hypothetical protein